MSGTSTAENFEWIDHEVLEPPMVRFLREINQLGLCESVQMDLLGCDYSDEFLNMIRYPRREVSESTALRISLLEKGYRGILRQTQCPDEILKILFSPLPEPPFFGVPPVRYLRSADINDVKLAMDFFYSPLFKVASDRSTTWARTNRSWQAPVAGRVIR